MKKSRICSFTIALALISIMALSLFSCSSAPADKRGRYSYDTYSYFDVRKNDADLYQVFCKVASDTISMITANGTFDINSNGDIFFYIDTPDNIIVLYAKYDGDNTINSAGYDYVKYN